MCNHQDHLSIRSWIILAITLIFISLASIQVTYSHAAPGTTTPNPAPPPTSIIGALPASSNPFAGPLPVGALVRFGKGAVSRVLVPATRDIYVVDTNLGIYTFDNKNKLLYFIDQTAFSIALSIDGKKLAVSIPGKISIFDAHTGSITRVIESSRPYLFNCLAYSADGSHLAAGSGGTYDTGHGVNRREYEDDNVVTLWNALDGTLIRTFKEHTKPVSTLAFSPDDTHLASASQDQTVKIWDVQKKHLVRNLEINHPPESTATIDSLAFSQDGAHLAAAALNGPIFLWQTSNWDLLYTLDGNAFSFTPDGTKILSLLAGELTFWDLQAGKANHTVVLQDDVLNLSQDGSILSIMSPEGIALLDLEEETDVRVIHTIPGFLGQTHTFAFAPSGKLLAVGCEGWIYLVNPDDGTVVKTIAGDFAGFDSGGNVLSRLHSSGGSDFISSVNGQKVASFDEEYANIIASDADGRILAVKTLEGVTFWDTATNKLFKTTMLFPEEWISAQALSPDGKTFAYSPNQNDAKEYPVYLLDVQTGNKSRVFSLPDPAAGLAFSPDNRTLAYSAYNQPIVFWDLQTKKTTRTLAGTEGNLGLSFSADGKMFAYAAFDVVWLIDALTGKPITKFSGHGMSVDQIKFSPNGKMLVSSSRDGTLLLWKIP